MKPLAYLGAVFGAAFGGTVGVLTTRWIAWLSGMAWEPGWGGVTGTLGAVLGACVGAGLLIYVLDKEGA